jgi:hypothetical protein
MTSSRRIDARPSSARRLIATVSVIAAASIGTLESAGPAAAASPAPPEFYGVATATALTPKDFQRLARANIRTVRIIMYRPAIENRAGQYYWKNFDSAVINATQAGVTLLPTVIGSRGGDPFRPPLYSEAERAGWQRFVRAAVDRYGAGGTLWQEVKECLPDRWCRPGLAYRPIRVWQLWSEPNLRYFWRPFPSPKEYAAVLQLGGDAVHAADPGAEVVIGGLMPGRGPNSIRQRDFLTQLYQTPGIKESFDGVAIQPFSRKPRSIRRRVKKIRRTTQAFGDGAVPLWITEFGWSNKGPKDHYLVTNRKGQAKRLKRTYKILARMRERYGIRAATWFTFRDGWSASYCEWCRGAGLLKKNRKPKKAWKKLAKLAGGKP